MPFSVVHTDPDAHSVGVTLLSPMPARRGGKSEAAFLRLGTLPTILVLMVHAGLNDPFGFKSREFPRNYHGGG